MDDKSGFSDFVVASNAIDDDPIMQSAILDELTIVDHSDISGDPTRWTPDINGVFVGPPAVTVRPAYHVSPSGDLIPGPRPALTIGEPIPSGVVPGVLVVDDATRDLRTRTGTRIVDGADTPTRTEDDSIDQVFAKAYTAGKLAYSQGYAAGSNPHAVVAAGYSSSSYNGRVEVVGWMAGWMDGMNEAGKPAVPEALRRRAIRVS